MDTEVTPAAASRRRPDRALLVIVGIIVALVVIAVVLVVSRGSAPLLDESTPEGIVQRYAQAVSDGDDETALGYLSSDARESCRDFYGDSDDGSRLTLAGVSTTGNSSIVTVSITTTYGYGLFGSSQSTFEDQFLLTKKANGWLIATAPYNFLICDPTKGN